MVAVVVAVAVAAVVVAVVAAVAVVTAAARGGEVRGAAAVKVRGPWVTQEGPIIYVNSLIGGFGAFGWRECLWPI